MNTAEMRKKYQRTSTRGSKGEIVVIADSARDDILALCDEIDGCSFSTIERKNAEITKLQKALKSILAVGVLDAGRDAVKENLQNSIKAINGIRKIAKKALKA